jgi:hypothetical protein
MRKRRLKDAVLLALHARDQMTLDELRSVIFATYSEPELMRRGAYYTGKKSRAQAAYIAGEFVDESAKKNLVSLGISKVVRDTNERLKAYVVLDKQKGVLRRVRV